MRQTVNSCTIDYQRANSYDPQMAIGVALPNLEKVHISEPDSEFSITAKMSSLTQFVLTKTFAGVYSETIFQVLRQCDNLTVLTVHHSSIICDVEDEGDDAALSRTISESKSASSLEHVELVCYDNGAPFGLLALGSFVRRCPRLKRVGMLTSWRKLKGRRAQVLALAEENGFVWVRYSIMIFIILVFSSEISRTLE